MQLVPTLLELRRLLSVRVRGRGRVRGRVKGRVGARARARARARPATDKRSAAPLTRFSMIWRMSSRRAARCGEG